MAKEMHLSVSFVLGFSLPYKLSSMCRLVLHKLGSEKLHTKRNSRK